MGQARGEPQGSVFAGGPWDRPSTAGPRPAHAGDLLLVHPGLAADALGSFLPAIWPDADLHRVPEGYREVTAALCGPRAFCRTELAHRVPVPDPELPARVRAWIDDLAERWRLAETFTTGEFGIWCFLRDRMAGWLHRRMVERRVIEGLAAEAPLALTGVGLGADQRALLRALSAALGDALRPEIGVLPPPAGRQVETVTERRLRKLFALLQDAWHGVRLLAEDLLVRQPKVLFISSSQCWQRVLGTGGGTRRDVHLGGVWRLGRGFPWRLYYRTERYDPEVGALTSGRLAPTYLRHFLFLLAQTSRGFWEVRGIQRQWRALRENRRFREALVFEGLDIGEMVLRWFDEAVNKRLPVGVRITRRETHFLRGARPQAILLAQSREENLPLISAARRLGIPTAALQLRPFHDWDHAYLHSHPAGCADAGLPDRLCVFSREVKSFLVREGGLDPSAVVVTGDPRRLGNGEPAAAGSENPEGGERGAAESAGTGAPKRTGGAAPAPARERALGNSASRAAMRNRWGVEADQRVVGVACRPTHTPQLLDWLSQALASRTDAFVLFHPSAEVDGEAEAYHGYLRRGDLRWFHVHGPDRFADWLTAVDVLITTTWAELCEGIVGRKPTVSVALGEGPRPAGPDPGELVAYADDPAGLAAHLKRALDDSPASLPADAAWQEFVAAVGGAAEGDPAARILAAVEELLSGPSA